MLLIGITKLKAKRVLNKSGTDTLLKKKFIKPYKNQELKQKSSLDDEESNARLVQLRQIADSYMQVTYDESQSLEDAQKLFRSMQSQENLPKNSEELVFKQGSIFRSKLQRLNQRLNESISKNTASVMISQHIQDQQKQKNLKSIGMLNRKQPEYLEYEKVKLEDLITQDEMSKSVDHSNGDDNYSRFKDAKSLYNLTKKELEDLKIKVSQSPEKSKRFSNLNDNKNLTILNQVNDQKIKKVAGQMSDSYYQNVATIKNIENDLNFPKLIKLREKNIIRFRIKK
ncbi:UNKNOWN [Stylonychia lemnae]|uniref:Uncharacterized protein n=1 Tax=Stylonychia lemnae TaxID=5949 RepID=A0A078B7Z2_STYLE|nr:UNKNOWN [Stylonychia lemnae]|eukprot:CDW90645.1 UNKNOWN [Stylonychia lemnae]